CWTACTNEKGKLIDWLRVLSMPDGLVVMTAGGRGDVLKSWFEQYIIMEDLSVEKLDWARVQLFVDVDEKTGWENFPTEKNATLRYHDGWLMCGLPGFKN